MLDFQIPGYTLGSAWCRTESKGGGTAIFLNSILEHQVLDKIEKHSLENIVEMSAIFLVGYNLYLITVYRPPAGDFNIFINQLTRAIDSIGQNRNILVIGDFNVLFGTNQTRSVELCDIFETYGLFPGVNVETRHGNCLDNVFMNFDTDHVLLDVINNGLSDHNSIEAKIPLPPQIKNKPTNKICRPITEVGKFVFYQLIEGLSWEFVGNNEVDVNNKFQIFCNLIKGAFCQAFPEKCYVKREAGKLFPWFNDSLRRMREQLHFLQDLCGQNHSLRLINQKNKFKNEYKAAIKQAKKNFNNNLIKNSSNKTKTMWNIINNNRASHQAKNADHNIAPDQFNDYFTNIAEQLLGKGHYTIDDVQNQPKVRDDVVFDFGEVTINEVRDVMGSLKNKDSKDISGLSVRIIKVIRELIIVPLTKLINLIFRERIFPNCLKEALVIPIFKKGSRDQVSNYRPISLLPVFSKIVEKCMAMKMAAYLGENTLLSERQFGFREGRSTVSGVLDLVSYIMDGFERRRHTGTIFCDLSKAFDCVSHGLLIRKLSYYNFNTASKNLLQSYLEHRTQRVVLDGVSSASGTINVGVPQGSVLGPLLFLLYINNLPNCSMGEHYVLFADDTTISVQREDEVQLMAETGEARSRADDWFQRNSLVLNNEKTDQMLFSLREVSECSWSRGPVRFLGVQLDSELRWDVHIDSVARKMNSGIFVLRSLVGCVSDQVLRTAYFALCHSVMSYAVLAWGHASRWRRVFSLQRRAVRVVGNLCYREDCKQKFKDLRILTFPSLYIYMNLIHIQSNLHLYPTNSQKHPLATRSREQLAVPLRRLERCRDGPNYLAVKFYNKLPDGYKCLALKEFKSGVRELLLNNPLYNWKDFL